MIPLSTYRFQFHKGFNFDQFKNCIEYLNLLGISTVYASPVFQSVPGSNHGYDTLDPHKINPEIGTLDQLKGLTGQLKSLSINWLQDIVPNHMAYSPGNSWLNDVLEKGPFSLYAHFFDECWASSFFKERLMVPFLGSNLKEAIEKNELKIEYKEDRFVFTYYDNSYPIQPGTYFRLIPKTIKNIVESLHQLPEQYVEDLNKTEYAEKWESILNDIRILMNNETKAKLIKAHIDKLNSQAKLITEIAEEQHYRLCHWQETDSEINYRRFFTVNGLICLNIQDSHVFNVYHEFIKQLINEGIIDGVRVDHIDGLYDPEQYLLRLRELAGEEVYIVVEKITEPGEQLPSWPIQGTTGYDFLAIVNNLFTYKKNEEQLSGFYEEFTNDVGGIKNQLIQKKSFILYNHMAGELENLYQYFLDLDLIEKQRLTTFRIELLKEAIAQFLIYCPVYRYYGNSLPFHHEEYHSVLNLLNRVRKENPDLERAIAILEEVLLKKPLEGNEDRNRRTLHFYQRCMQFTGPLMAKGMEDTLMYTYNRFIGHNDVGDSPESFGITIKEFHLKMNERLKQWPNALNATSTHDTKRGEDARARLNVITELADEWVQLIRNARDQNRSLKKDNGPDENDEYFIYQTIAATYPLLGEETGNYNERIKEYLQKALREEKIHSNWTKPDTEYEKATQIFSEAILNADSKFFHLFQPFLQKISEYGIINSLVQLVLKCTCPGIPDTYQGCELWDLSLVDPDNRRPVDYNKRIQFIHELKNDQSDANVEELWKERNNGKIKLWLLQTFLSIRNQYPDVFLKGDYIPLNTEGSYKDHVIAYARKYGKLSIIIILPLHMAAMTEGNEFNSSKIDWKDTRVTIPKAFGKEWENMLHPGEKVQKNGLSVGKLFQQLPVAILKGSYVNNERASGLLLHISSLPSQFGIGDMGPEANILIDFLKNNKQKYWQLLPLNPTEQGQGHSPYSSTSSHAGNILFISPEALSTNGLLSSKDLQDHKLNNQAQVNFSQVENIKLALFDIAWQNHKNGNGKISKADVNAFVEKESAWLNDFALYMVLKKTNNGKPWYEWEDKFKLRQVEALEQISQAHSEELNKIKWLQYIFNRQWKDLRNYCNGQGIKLIGDLPFYISYDSVDVWANKEIFAIDNNGNRIGMAGVPPDAFSEDGQLWGMPVFQWDVLKEHNYKWWIDRLRKNMELFDLIRLDHFRAFAAYWEVPANEQTARNGSWKPGPSIDFFNAVKEQLGQLPFIAEDLGDIDEAVYELRDAFDLPGMKVLQFAFSEDIAVSPYIPHNYDHNFIVYTGTHDNNTMLGWFRNEGLKDHERIEKYIGRSLSENDIADVFCKMALSSVARTSIIPVQDLLGLDENARMNKPSQAENNWSWRLLPGQLNDQVLSKLNEWTILFNRD